MPQDLCKIRIRQDQAWICRKSADLYQENSKLTGSLSRKSIRQALHCWDNSRKLGEHPLAHIEIVEARRRAAGYRSAPIGYGVALRDLLHHVIKKLRLDDGDTDYFEKGWRSYLILSEEYIRGRSPDYLCEQLGIARSTYNHAQADALDTVVDLLREWEEHGSLEDADLALLRPERPKDRLPPFLAPPRPPQALIGRESLLRRLKQRLLSDSQTTVAISGLPGVGKSTLAIELAHDPQVKGHFEEGVLWAGLGRQPDGLVLLSLWAVALGVPLEEIAGLDRLEDRAKAIHAAIGMRRMLIVIDDVWQAGEGLVFKIGGSNCGYLVTTRLPKVAVEMAGNGAVAVHELDETDGLTLIEGFVPEVVSAEPDEARALVRNVGGLPLALVLMGRYLQQETRSGQPRRLKAALARLQDTSERLELAQSQTPLDHQPSLESSEPLSLQTVISISVQGLDDPSRQALEALSVLPPKPNTFSETAAMEIAGVPAEVLDTLTDFGLLESSAPGRYMLHRSISEYAKVRLKDETVYERMVDTFVSYVEAYHQEYPMLDPEAQNIFAALQVASEREMHSALIRGANAFYPYLEAVGLLTQAEVHLKRAEDAARLIGDGLGLTTILENIGRAAQRRGDYLRAVRVYREGLDLSHKYEDVGSECAMLQGLGVVAFSQGDFEKAEEVYLRGLDLARKIDQLARVSALLANLGTLEFSRGDASQAEARFREGLTLARGTEDRAHVGSLLMNLGVVLASRREYEGADTCFQESLELARSGGNRKNISFLLTNLGALASDRGDDRQAEMHFQEALTLAREMDDPARVCHLLANLGAMATSRESYAEAEKYLREGLELAREIGHRGHITLLLTNLGVLDRERGNYERAEISFGEALELATDMGQRRYISVVLSKWGELHLKREVWDAAEEAFEKSREVAREIGLQEFVATALYGLARVAKARGRVADAVRQGEESLSLFQEINHTRGYEVITWLKEIEES